MCRNPKELPILPSVNSTTMAFETCLPRADKLEAEREDVPATNSYTAAVDDSVHVFLVPVTQI